MAAPQTLDYEPAPADASAPLAGARTALVLLLLINMFNYVDRQVLAAVEGDIQKAFNAAGQTFLGEPIGAFHMGLLASAFLVTYTLVAPLFGLLADRISRWILVGVGVLLWSLASGASGLAGGFGVLFVTRCFVGVGEAAYGPVAPTILSDLYPVKIRGRILSWFYVAIPVGSALGYVLGGQVMGLAQRHGAAEPWRWPFYVVVPPGIALGLWALFMRDRRGSAAGPVHKASRRDLALLVRNRSYVLNTLGMAAMTFAVGGIAFFMPRYIVEARDYGDKQSVNTTFGLIVVVSGLIATLSGGIIGDWLRKRFSGSYFLVSGIGMIVAFPLFLLLLVTPFPAAWWLLFATCFCLFFNTGPTNTILANVTHPSIRASAFAINILVIHLLGDVISPPIIGFIQSRTGSWNTAFGAVAVMIFVGGVLWLLGTRHLAEDTAKAPQAA